MFVEEYLQDLRASGYSRSAWGTYARRLGERVGREVWNNPQATRSVLTVGMALFILHLLWSMEVSFAQGPERAVAYLWGAGLTTLAATLFCLSHLGLVRTRDGVPCARLGAADWLTLARITMAPGAFLFAAAGAWPMMLGWIVAGGLTDVADGALARRLDIGTALGTLLDPLVDIGFNSCMFLGLYAGGLVPGWVLGLVLARYGLLVVGGAFIYITRGPVRIRPTIFGKASGILIFLLVGARVALAAYGGPELSARAAQLLELGVGLLSLATVFHVGVMGWHNAKLAPQPAALPAVVADVSFKPGRRRDL